jgi:hypothetical protein
MNLLFFLNVTITLASHEAAGNKRDENFEFEVCPESHNYAFDQGEV